MSLNHEGYDDGPPKFEIHAGVKVLLKNQYSKIYQMPIL